MLKWLFISAVWISLVSCSEDFVREETETSKIVKTEPDEIRIYADTIGWDNKLPCTINYKGRAYQAEVKFRGGMSSQYPKHSMTIELEQDAVLSGLPANDDWILNASYIDKTFQRHKLSYDIFRKMHPENIAPGCSYVSVYHNDNYIGLYVLMEKINGSLLGFDKNRPENALLFKDAFVFIEERLPNVQEPDNYYQQKFPSVEQGELSNAPEEFKAFLFNSSDKQFTREIENWVDLRNIVDWHLLLLLTNNDDGVIKNYYLFRTAQSEQFGFIPWDYDHSFGRDGNYELNLIEREVGWNKAVLLNRLFAIKETGYADRLAARYTELRKELFTEEALLEMIELNDSLLRPYLKANEERWPNDATWYSDANDYKKEIEILKQYIPLRLKQLDDFFNKLEHGEEEKN